MTPNIEACTAALGYPPGEVRVTSKALALLIAEARPHLTRSQGRGVRNPDCIVLDGCMVVSDDTMRGDGRG